jgi:hypothetical protein
MKNMKISKVLAAMLILLMTGFILQAQTSQDVQEKKKKEQEMQIREMEMQLKKQQLEQEQKMKELERVHEEQARRSSGVRNRAMVFTPSYGSDEGAYLIQSYGQGSQSQLTLRNSFNGETVASTGEFDVDESATHLRFTVNGKVRHGEISIRVLYPGGKVFKDLNINSSAEITFNQSLTIKEDEKKKYVGVWKYEVKAKTAEGNYMLSIMTH